MDEDDNRIKIKNYLVSYGTTCLCKALPGEVSMLACCFAMTILLLENYAPGPIQKMLIDTVTFDGDNYMKVLDAAKGCERSLIKFFKSRLPCGCLDKKYEEVKAGKRKTGICAGCKVRKQRRELSVCQGCKITQYCSKSCRANHWRLKHKEQCIVVQKAYEPKCVEDADSKSQLSELTCLSRSQHDDTKIPSS